MKKFFSSVVMLLFIALKGYGQQKTDSIDFKKYLGKTATLCDYVSGIKNFGDTLILVNMGGEYPHQKFTIAVKGKQIRLDWNNLKGKHLCATGVLELYKNQLEIVATEPKQIVVQ
jgi:hypothetical protein